MKLLCTVLNAIALITVLLLGTVSVHAESDGHDHRQIVSASEMVAVVDRADLQEDGPSPSDPAMHCGAPILGSELLPINCTVRVTQVDFYPEVMPFVSGSISDNLRPPRA